MSKQQELLKAITQAFDPCDEPVSFDAVTWASIHAAITELESQLATAKALGAEEGRSKRVPLTEDAIHEISCAYDECKTSQDIINFARAIEREHGIGEQG